MDARNSHFTKLVNGVISMTELKDLSMPVFVLNERSMNELGALMKRCVYLTSLKLTFYSIEELKLLEPLEFRD